MGIIQMMMQCVNPNPKRRRIVESSFVDVGAMPNHIKPLFLRVISCSSCVISSPMGLTHQQRQEKKLFLRVNKDITLLILQQILSNHRRLEKIEGDLCINLCQKLNPKDIAANPNLSPIFTHGSPTRDRAGFSISTIHKTGTI